MVCKIVEVSETGVIPPPPPGATHVFIINIWKAFPWSKSGAEAVAKIADYLAGVEVFGYKLDMSSITGWDPIQVEYDDETSRIYIWFEKTGSPAIPPIMIGVIAILLILGLIIIGWKFMSIAGDIIETIDNKLRADCIKERIDEGYTPEEALALCPISKEDDSWASKLIPIAGMLGLAYVAAEVLKSK